jgi:hypothetical protein
MGYPESGSDFWEHLQRAHKEQHEGFETKLFHRIHTLERNLMASLEPLASAIAQLEADVGELVAAQGSQITQEQVESETAKVAALDETVKTALAPAPAA